MISNRNGCFENPLEEQVHLHEFCKAVEVSHKLNKSTRMSKISSETEKFMGFLILSQVFQNIGIFPEVTVFCIFTEDQQHPSWRFTNISKVQGTFGKYKTFYKFKELHT